VCYTEDGNNAMIRANYFKRDDDGLQHGFVMVMLPKEAYRFMQEFDCPSSLAVYHLTEDKIEMDKTAVIKERMRMPEISFIVDLPQSIIDFVGQSDVYKTLSESRTLELADNYVSI
jgi:hypothetical protein